MIDVFLLLTKYMEHVKFVYGNTGIDHMSANDDNPTGPYFSADEQSELHRIDAFLAANPDRHGATLTPPVVATPIVSTITATDVIAGPPSVAS